MENSFSDDIDISRSRDELVQLYRDRFARIADRFAVRPSPNRLPVHDNGARGGGIFAPGTSTSLQ
jgi:hypothetical protein